MTAERGQPDDAQKLPDEAVRRLLARASELESARSAQLTLAELRDVALEAGIAPGAFEQAVVELQSQDSITDSEPVKRSRKVRSRFATIALESLRTVGLIVATLIFLMLMVDLF